MLALHQLTENEVWGTLYPYHRFNEGINYYFSTIVAYETNSRELNGFFEHPPTSSTTSLSLLMPSKPPGRKIDSFEMGLQANLAKDVFGVSIFNYYDGFIDLIKQPSPGVLDLYSNDNVGKVEIHGVELSWEKRLEIRRKFSALILGFHFHGLKEEKRMKKYHSILLNQGN